MKPPNFRDEHLKKYLSCHHLENTGLQKQQFFKWRYMGPLLEIYLFLAIYRGYVTPFTTIVGAHLVRMDVIFKIMFLNSQINRYFKRYFDAYIR